MDVAKNVLLVTNAASDQEIELVKNAIDESAKKRLFIKLSLVHVIPNLPTCYFNIPSMAQLAEQYYSEAKKCLNLVGDTLEVGKKDQWLITGRVKTEVLRLAAKLNSQFILASSSHIQELHTIFGNSKTKQATQLKNINHLTASNF